MYTTYLKRAYHVIQIITTEDVKCVLVLHVDGAVGGTGRHALGVGGQPAPAAARWMITQITEPAAVTARAMAYAFLATTSSLALTTSLGTGLILAIGAHPLAVTNALMAHALSMIMAVVKTV